MKLIKELVKLVTLWQWASRKTDLEDPLLALFIPIKIEHSVTINIPERHSTQIDYPEYPGIPMRRPHWY